MAKILHVITSIDPSKGGTSASVLAILLLQLPSISQDLFYLEESKIDDNLNKVSSNIHFITLKDIFKKEFWTRLCSYDFIHFHGIWQFKLNILMFFAALLKLQYIVSFHGMLEPWSLKQKKNRKRLAWFVYQKYLISKSYCYHVTSNMELFNIRKFGVTGSAVIIPNILLDEFAVLKESMHRDDRIKFVFISRIHPKKGLDNFLLALRNLEPQIQQRIQLEIIGDGNLEYLQELNSKTHEYRLHNVVTFLGPKYGIEKFKLLSNADVFILPSFSENFGIVVIEALLSGVPVLTSIHTPWSILEAEGCGWCVDNSVECLHNTISTIMRLDRKILAEMGHKGKLLYNKKYSRDKVISEYLELYTSTARQMLQANHLGNYGS